MKLIIDISEEEWLFIKAKIASEDDSYIDRVVANGTPIPGNATNGDVVKLIFDEEDIWDIHTALNLYDDTRNWWDAPYQKGNKE